MKTTIKSSSLSQARREAIPVPKFAVYTQNAKNHLAFAVLNIRARNA